MSTDDLLTTRLFAAEQADRAAATAATTKASPVGPRPKQRPLYTDLGTQTEEGETLFREATASIQELARKFIAQGCSTREIAAVLYDAVGRVVAEESVMFGLRVRRAERDGACRADAFRAAAAAVFGTLESAPVARPSDGD